MTAGFLPGLILGLIALALWVEAYGWPRYQTRVAAERMRRNGFCPDCGLPFARCHCFTDGGVL